MRNARSRIAAAGVKRKRVPWDCAHAQLVVGRCVAPSHGGGPQLAPEASIAHEGRSDNEPGMPCKKRTHAARAAEPWRDIPG
jgi:hypothetical protein